MSAWGWVLAGNTGRGQDDELRLNEIRHEQARRLGLPVEEVRNLDKITSQPYQLPTPHPRPLPHLLAPLLLKAGLALAALLLVPLAIVLSFWRTGPDHLLHHP